MKIFSGSTSVKLTDRICDILSNEFGVESKPGKLKIDKFLDGEILPLITDKPRCENENDEYIWIDNRKVRGVTYNEVWGDLKKVNKEILTFGD
jgi:hypothetical protein